MMPVIPIDRRDEIVSKLIVVGESFYAGWPPGHPAPMTPRYHNFHPIPGFETVSDAGPTMHCPGLPLV